MSIGVSLYGVVHVEISLSTQLNFECLCVRLVIDLIGPMLPRSLLNIGHDSNNQLRYYVFFCHDEVVREGCCAK